MNLTGTFNSTASADTLLMDAVKNSDAEMVKKLLELGADINTPQQPSSRQIPPFPVPMPVPGPAATAAAPAANAAAANRTKPVVTKMGTHRQVAAPQTARFRKKSPPKRQTTL